MDKEPTRLGSMHQLAGHYAKELEAQFETLNLFVSHAGEIGRAHEAFIRAVLQRFLPAKFRCGAGFVATPDLVSRQQDVIIFDPTSRPLLFEIGDCVVVDSSSVAATVEVKSRLDSTNKFTQAINGVTETRRAFSGGESWFTGLYVWKGPSLERALECFWQFYEAQSRLDRELAPSAVYVRGAYLIIRSEKGHIDQPPLQVLRITDSLDEGAALLSFVVKMWHDSIAGRHAPWPWWAEEWQRKVSVLYEPIPWPRRLQARAGKQLTKERAERAAAKR